MSIQKLNPDDFEYFTLETNPSRLYASSSTGEITGSVYLFARRSESEKEIHPLSSFQQTWFSDGNLDDIRKRILTQTGSNISSSVIGYLNAVDTQPTSSRKNQRFEVVRFTPGVSFDSDTLRKSVVLNTLMPYYRSTYPRAHYTLGNYNCLNFFTGSGLPSGSALLYPNPARSGSNPYNLSTYGVSGAFSIDFWLKPTYTTDGVDSGSIYRPGGILHLSGAYCVSLHSSSHRDINGRPDTFRIMLQLSSSANTTPSNATTDSRTFLSSDSVTLKKDAWSRVTIRWGGTGYNNGSGSFMVNNQDAGTFTVTESLRLGSYADGDPSVLVVGNYYEGTNVGTQAMDYFFTQETATREGLYALLPSTEFGPVSASFTHPLNAEVHEIKLFEKYLFSTDVERMQETGPKVESGLLFYLPPLFTEESPFRTYVGGQGGVFITPFQTKNASTVDPFGVEMAFSVNGLYMNLENYVRDFATGRYPRLWELTGSVYSQQLQTGLEANTILYATGSNQKRLYTILPCDNGNFQPNYDLLAGLSGSKFVNDLGNPEPGVISLRNLVSMSFAATYVQEESGSLIDALVGARPGAVVGRVNSAYTILHRTRDNSSNQAVFFDISNLFYGKQIKPGSVELTDTSLSSSGGKVSITLKDDGLGNLYRANASGSNATWASVGNVFYDEGIILIKQPQFFFFGKNQFELTFKGVQDIHVLTINAFARSMQLISSSNTAYTSGSIDGLANRTDDKYVYITEVLVHDDNLNVITRTTLAQPFIKYSGDKIRAKIKLDF
jgi:hypothetical protein